MDAIGDTSGSCTTTKVDQSPHTISASSDERGSGVNNIKIKHGYSKLVVGRVGNEDFKQWFFTPTKPLIGLYGR